jgi:hypothetical protein
MLSVRGALRPSDLGFPYQRFSLPVATKPAVLKHDKAERVLKVATMVLIWNDLSTTSNCFLLPSFPC